MELYAAILVGALGWALLRLNSALKRKDFTFNGFIKKNIIPLVLNLFFGSVLVWMREDIVNVLVITKFSAVMLGAQGQSVFEEISKVWDKEKDTLISTNKKVTSENLKEP